MAKAELALAIHFHQPVGNFDHIFERVYDRCYRPFLEVLGNYPGISATLHYSGSLLEWLEKNRPEVFEIINGLVSSGQVELMGGGFYEPILPIIPYRDRVGQLNMMKNYIYRKFNYAVEGAWVAERVWEPSLPEALNEAGMKYVIVDDTHLYYAGVKKEQMYGYYVTEEQNKTVAVFPSDKTLRYYLPFRPPEETIEYFRQLCGAQENPLFVYGDDGEKFGEWPGTHKWVYEEKWLVNFFDALRKNSDWLETVLLSDCLKNHPPAGRVYMPTAAYEEMAEWSLPVETENEMESVVAEIKEEHKEERFKPFVRGGFWRNFLVKYPESNQLHKKMLYVSGKVRRLLEEESWGEDRDELVLAERELYKGQCNCAYWHGVFGGLYLYHLRSTLYRHLLNAEVIADRKERGEKFESRIEVFDFDADGREEIILENDTVSLYVDPGEGGMVTELDYRPALVNLVNTLSRRKEAYHKKLEMIGDDGERGGGGEMISIHEQERAGGADFKGEIFYDRWRRGLLTDHFIAADLTLADFISSRYDEAGDFCARPYRYKFFGENGKKTVSLRREAEVMGRKVSVSKEVGIGKIGSQVEVNYVVSNPDGGLKNLCFGVEFNFTPLRQDLSYYVFSSPDGISREAELLSEGNQKEVDEFTLVDKGGLFAIVLKFDSPARVWHFPVRTLSQSERNFELNYQGSAIIPAWKLDISPGSELKVSIEMEIKSRRF